MKKIVIYFLLFVSTGIKNYAQTLPDSINKKIDYIFSKWDNNVGPGCVVGVVENDSLIYSKGYGLSNLEYGIANSPSTEYHVASISKQFTAFCILLLAQEGKLNLDDNVNKYLKWYPDLQHKITIRHLLNHTSGIRDQWQLLAIAGTRLDDVIKQDQIISVLSKQKALNSNPGDIYNYSNSGYTMLAEIIREVSDKTFRKFADSAIFKPLKMTNSYFYDDYTEIVKNRAYSYEKIGTSQYKNSILSYSTVGATGLLTNVNDLSKWLMNFYLNKIGSNAIEQLTQKSRLNNNKEISYALGIEVDNYKGRKRYFHGGGDAGFRAYMSVFPEMKLGFVILANTSELNSKAKLAELADIFIKPNHKINESLPNIKIDTSVAFIKNPSYFDRYMGKYLSEDGRYLGFKMHNKKIYLNVNNRDYLLTQCGTDTFSVFVSPNTKYIFSSTVSQDTIVNEYSLNVGDRTLFKMPPLTNDNEQQLLTYTGTYNCPELDCKYEISLKERTLFLVNTKYGASKLTKYSNDHFKSSFDWMGHLRILRDTSNKIIGFEVNEGRVLHLHFDKIR